MKKFISIALILVMILSLCACNNEPEQPTTDENPYILANGLSPTQFQNRIASFIRDIYSPKSQDTIDKAIKGLADIATELEINELQNTVGTFDKDKRAVINNLEVNLCMPDNSGSRNYKIAATFTISLNGVKQGILIEFNCNNDVKIDSHSIWINNSV